MERKGRDCEERSDAGTNKSTNDRKTRTKNTNEMNSKTQRKRQTRGEGREEIFV